MPRPSPEHHMDESVINGIFWNHLVYPELASDEVEDPAILLTWVHERLPEGRWPEYVACLAVDGLDAAGSSERRETVRLVREIITETLLAPQCSVLGFAHTNALYFCGHAVEGVPAFLDRLARLNGEVADGTGLPCTVGVAFLRETGLAGLQWAAQHAIVAQRQKVRTGTDRVYLFDPAAPVTTLDMGQCWALARSLQAAMKSGDAAATEAAVGEVAGALFQRAYLPLNHLRPVLQCQVLAMAQAATDAMAGADPVAEQTERFLSQIATAYDYDRLNEILAEAARAFAGLVSERYRSHTHRLAAAVDDDIAANRADPDLSLARIAARLGVSPAHLSRTYKKVKGFGITHAIQRRRLEDAQRRMLDPGMSITQAALDSGFTSLQHFGRVFKEICGMTPSAFRAKNAASHEGGVAPRAKNAASGAKSALPAGRRNP